MKVPIKKYDEDTGMVTEEINIIGGYSSDSWLITAGDE